MTLQSEDNQDLRVRILNVIGEELINENLEQFIGEYTKQINLSDNAKGIYFLEIETNDGIINKKLILQFNKCIIYTKYFYIFVKIKS